MRAAHALRAAVVAGLVGGTVATVFQLVAWSLHGDPLPETFHRDTRFAAAIVMGRDVLPPPATFDLRVAAAATALHFALSIVYALAIAPLVASARTPAALGIGALFGTLIFAVNMYGFTAVWPWFAATRDAITLAAHAVFGASAAIAYRLAARRRGAAPRGSA
jgi:hypothetical protein